MTGGEEQEDGEGRGPPYPFLSIAIFQVVHRVLLPFHPEVNEGAGSKALLCIHGEIHKKSSQGLHET